MMTPNNNQETLWEIWSGTDQVPAGSHYEEDLKALHRAMGIVPRTHHIIPRIWYAVAAVVLLFVVCGEYLVLKNRIQPIETVKLVSSSGTKGEFELPDGTHVWLNSSSTLSYNAANPREVKLNGEGFFDVTQNGQPFVVKAGSISVRVLGTKFNVRSSSHYEGEEVSLVSGKVEILSGNESVTMSPGERVTVHSGKLDKIYADITYDASWIGQELIFDNAALSDILIGLEHWYNVNIKVEPSVVLTSRLSFKLGKESLEETERVISHLTGCRFKVLDENNIIVTKR